MPRYAGGSGRSAVSFKWQREEYTPTGLQGVPTQEINKEYSRLRDIAMKRLARLEKSVNSEEFGDMKHARNFLNYYAPRFKKLEDIKSPKQLRRALSDLRYYLESPFGSVAGYKDVRRKQIQTLHEHGIKWINTQNLSEFQDFMEWIKSDMMSAVLYAPEDAKFYKEQKKKGLSGDEIKEEYLSWKKEQAEKSTDMVNRKSAGQKTKSTARKQSSMVNMTNRAYRKTQNLASKSVKKMGKQTNRPLNRDYSKRTKSTKPTKSGR